MNVEASLLLKSDVAPQDNLDEEQVTHTEAHPVVVNAPSDVDILVEDGGQAVKERRSERLKKPICIPWTRLPGWLRKGTLKVT